MADFWLPPNLHGAVLPNRAGVVGRCEQTLKGPGLPVGAEEVCDARLRERICKTSNDQCRLPNE